MCLCTAVGIVHARQDIGVAFSCGIALKWQTKRMVCMMHAPLPGDYSPASDIYSIGVVGNLLDAARRKNIIVISDLRVFAA